MAFSVKHSFASLKVDGGDASFVQPSKWNAEHVLLFSATSLLLGRLSAGAGAAEEVPFTALAVPSGSILSYAPSGSVPTGYLSCNGQAVSRTTFANLFGLIGTTYGAGDGSLTFNVPDLRGRVVAGMDIMDGSTNAGRIGSVTLGAGLGTASNSTTTSVGITSTGTNNFNFGSVGVTTTGFYAGGSVTNVNAAGPVPTISTDVVISASGSTNAINGNFGVSVFGSGNFGSAGFSIIQPTMVMNKIIKT